MLQALTKATFSAPTWGSCDSMQYLLIAVGPSASPNIGQYHYLDIMDDILRDVNGLEQCRV